MKKVKPGVKISATAIVCVSIILYFVIFMPSIAMRTWVLSYAQRVDAPQFVVAHNKDMDLSNDISGLYNFSKPIELICEAKNGELVLTDKTNGKTYAGTYKMTSIGGSYGSFKGAHYSIVIEGIEGTANVSANRMLFMFIGGYLMTFDVY